MLAAALLLATYSDWVPARWPSSDLTSLDLLKNTPINCLWLERPNWSAAFAAEAARRGIATLGVIHREGDAIAAARELAKSGFTGGVIEGTFDEYSMLIVGGTLAKAKMLAIEAGPRSHLKLNSDSPILATAQGMWPGIHVEKGSTANAGPTANPWIDTNTGFLRYVRASTPSTIWVAVQPPAKTAYPVARYLQAIGDAAMNGGRWVVDLDDDLQRRLLAHDPKALDDWNRIGAALRHFEEHPEWRQAAPAGDIAISDDYSDARLSGGLLDMLAAKHVPMSPVPAPEAEKFAHAGKLVVEGPRKVEAPEEALTFDSSDSRPDAIWRKLSETIGRQNMGARLFNVASMLSNLLALRGSRQTILHLVNYSDYPAAGITARVKGNFQRARLYRPAETPVDLEIEKTSEGTGFAIDQRIMTIATVVLE